MVTWRSSHQMLPPMLEAARPQYLYLDYLRWSAGSGVPLPLP